MTNELNTQDLTSTEMIALANSLQDQAAEKRKAERRAELAARRAAEAAKAKSHYDDLFTEIGQPLAGLNEKQHGIVYAEAYDRGHSSGYDEVTGYYEELAGMARRIIDAA